jgi:Leucine-rich repeat (LRR) protein
LNVGIRELHCVNTELTSLPPLPDTLIILTCLGNRLTELPKLPPNLRELYFNHNNINIIPELPDSLTKIWLHNNPLQEPFLTCYNNYRFHRDITVFKREINALYSNSKRLGRNLMTLRQTVGRSYPEEVEAYIGSFLTGKKGSINQQVLQLKETTTRIPGAAGATRKRKARKRKARKSRSNRK